MDSISEAFTSIVETIPFEANFVTAYILFCVELFQASFENESDFSEKSWFKWNFGGISLGGRSPDLLPLKSCMY